MLFSSQWVVLSSSVAFIYLTLSLDPLGSLHNVKDAITHSFFFLF